MRRRLTVEELDARLVPTYLGNQLFPLDNPWNQNVAGAPVSASSAAIVSAIVARHGGTAPRLHADFGNPLDGNLYGIPVNVATSSTPRYNIYFPPEGYADESDVVPVPIPTGAVIEGDFFNGPSTPADRGDSHLLVYDKDANVLYELYQAIRPNETAFPYGGTKPSTTQWGAYQISVWDLNANSFRTIGATSADAAGLPILPGLVRPDETNPASAGGVGVIDHAIRMTVVKTASYVYPASHHTSGPNTSDLPRMGERFRLKANFAVPTTWSPEAKAIATAMKTYGLIVADNGSDMFFQGTPSDQWNMNAVLDIQAIPATQFDVVDLAPAVTGLGAASGSAGTSVTIAGRNFGGAAGQLHVLFGGTEATSVTIVSDTQLVAVAPAHAAGQIDVRVQSGTNRLNTNGQQEFFGYGTSPAVAADHFTYGGTPPQVKSVVINDGSAQRSLVRSITITFDTLVTLDAGAFQVKRSNGTVAGLTKTVTQANGETTVVLTFSGTGTYARSLVDGLWTLKIYKSKVHRADYRPAVMAADALTAFHRLYGDADGDRDVDATDRTAFDAAFGHTDPVSLATFDFDRDGDVDTLDRTRFNQRYGHTV